MDFQNLPDGMPVFPLFSLTPRTEAAHVQNRRHAMSARHMLVPVCHYNIKVIVDLEQCIRI